MTFTLIILVFFICFIVSYRRSYKYYKQSINIINEIITHDQSTHAIFYPYALKSLIRTGIVEDCQVNGLQSVYRLAEKGIYLTEKGVYKPIEEKGNYRFTEKSKELFKEAP